MSGAPSPNPKTRPILFSAPMVRAILAGRKTQTRRIVKRTVQGSPYREDWIKLPGAVNYHTPPCPYGRPGDELWVRETWVELLAVSPATDQPMTIGPGERLIEEPTFWVDDQGRKRWHFDGTVIAYRANSNVEFCDGDGFMGDLANREDMPRWRPSIHMPRWASRITLRITGTRVERLQDISAMDAIAEGIHRIGERWEAEGICATPVGPTDAYRALWNYINGPGSWDLNPWVWVIDFERVEAQRVAA